MFAYMEQQLTPFSSGWQAHVKYCFGRMPNNPAPDPLTPMRRPRGVQPGDRIGYTLERFA